MPNPNAVVSTVIGMPRLDRPLAEMLRAEGGISVELEGDRRARLDPDDPRSEGFAQILDGLSRQGLPVYVELDPETSSIARLLIPHVSRVIRISPTDEQSLSVDLELSHARHVLRRGGEDFELLQRRLSDALESGRPVILTEDDAHEIINVRDYAPGPQGAGPPFFEAPPRKPWEQPRARRALTVWRWRLWPWWWCWCRWCGRCVSPQRAQQAFDAMGQTSCYPLRPQSPCIPFLYPDDGCWARAHEMCRLMIGMGLSPRKVWIQGSLHVNTRNNPNCYVDWGWHVAPTLCVCGPRFWQAQDVVIDPSLFTTPVSKATWKGVQGDPNATLTDSDASDYLWGQTDPTYAQTNSTLAYYRLQLQSRSVQQGPPPYANCP